MNKPDISYSNIVSPKHGLLPQEEMLEVDHKKKKLIIGIPSEDHSTENRVPLTPEAVEILVQNGHEVIIEKGAGKGANYTDIEYAECGGFIAKNRKEIFKSDIIIKIAPFSEEEINDLKGDQLLLSSIHINKSTKKYITSLMKKKITAISCDHIRDEYNTFPVERSMNTIAGSTSILIAAEYLSNAQKGKGVMLGGLTGISPTEVVILGAGTAAEFAARAALGLGASVKIFDNSISKLRRIQEKLGNFIFTSIFHPRVLEKALKSADVAIGAISDNDGMRNIYVSEELVKKMKEGSVIIDLTLDQGRCFETSEVRSCKDPVCNKHGVLHYCVPNLPSRVSRTASIALSNIFSPLLLKIAESGGYKHQLKIDTGLRNGVYIYNGILTSSMISKLYDIPSQNIDLLLAAF